MSDQNAREIFKANLNRIMANEGIEQIDIVNALHVTASTVSDWTLGKKYPRVDAMQELADFFGLKLSDLTSEKSDEDFAMHHVAIAMKKEPKLKVLFDRSLKMSEKELDAVLTLIDSITKERDGADE